MIKKTKTVAVYVIFVIVLVVLRARMSYISDDAEFPKIFGNMNIGQCIQICWNESTGKVLTDTLGAILLRIPMWIWKLADSFFYLFIARCITLMFTKDTLQDRIVICMLMLMYPVKYLESAGYIVTSTNYVYTGAGIILTFLPHMVALRTKWIRVCSYLLSFIGVIYAADQEQSGVFILSLLGFYLVFQIYYLKNVEEKTASLKFHIRLALFQLMLGMTSFCFLFVSPAHRRRTAEVGGQFAVPGYENWSLVRKLYRGYTSTVANVIFQPISIYILLIAFLLILAIVRRDKVKTLFAMIPVLLEICLAMTKYSHFVQFPEYGFGLPDLKSVFESGLRLIPLFLSVCVIVIVVCLLYTLISSKKMAVMAVVVFILGAGTREMMGLSSTLFGSSYRTFTLFLYSMMFCCITLYSEIWEYTKDRKYVRAMCMAIMGFMTVASVGISYQGIK